MAAPVQPNAAGGAAAAAIGKPPPPLPIAPSGREVGRKFPLSSDTIVRQLSGSNTTSHPSPRVAESLQLAALEGILSRGGGRGANVSVFA